MHASLMREQMNEEEQKLPETNTQLSPFAKEETYGEKKYHAFFNVFINFWVNLGVSAVFTYWVSHSTNPIKLPFSDRKFPSPSELQKRVAHGIHNLPFMRVFGLKDNPDPNNMRVVAAGKMANTLTLVTAGHPIMIPSVWLGAKIKPAFVRYFDRKHYGDEAMESADLKARHAAIDVAERPTFIGAVVGRIGTIFATQFTTYSIGSSTNAINWTGKKLGIQRVANFPGIDKIAEVFGNNLGRVPEELMPKRTAAIDEHLSANGYNWSGGQLNDYPELKGQPYKRSAQHLGKYLAQDVLYTVVTATSISPIINTMKKFIPGLTYKPTTKIANDTPAVAPEKLHLRPPVFADAAPPAAPRALIADNQNRETANDHAPLSRVSHIQRDTAQNVATAPVSNAVGQ